VELPVATALNIREVDKAVTGHIRRDDYTPAFVSIETPDHAGHAALWGGCFFGTGQFVTMGPGTVDLF
jgi:hypothetical protein